MDGKQGTKLEPAEFAWPAGDAPGRLRFSAPVTSECEELLAAAVGKWLPSLMGEDIRVSALTPPGRSMVGRYRLVAGPERFFVRITSRIGNPSLEADITEFIGDGCPGISRLLFFDVFEWDGKRYRLDVHPFFEGRHFNGSMEDLSAVSRSLGLLHRRFKNYRNRNEIRSEAGKRYQQVGSAVEWIEGALKTHSFDVFENAGPWMEKNAPWLAEMVKRFQPLFHLLPNAQCLHGEVHPGNVIFSKNEDEVVFVDFEESVHTYTSPSWDLAFLVQRYCLWDDPAPETLRERLETVRAGYNGQMGGLARMMRQAAWFSMAVLVHQTINDRIFSPISEYDKFKRLERQVKKYGKMLDEC